MEKLKHIKQLTLCKGEQSLGVFLMCKLTVFCGLWILQYQFLIWKINILQQESVLNIGFFIKFQSCSLFVFRSEEMKLNLNNLPQWWLEVLNAWTAGDSGFSFYESFPLLAVDAPTLIMMATKEVNTTLLIIIIHWLYIVSEPCVHTPNCWPRQHAF